MALTGIGGGVGSGVGVQGERADGGQALQGPVERAGSPAVPGAAGASGPPGPVRARGPRSAPRGAPRPAGRGGPGGSGRGPGPGRAGAARAPAGRPRRPPRRRSGRPLGAGCTRDQASKRATQPRSTAESSRSQACSRQPGRAVSPWSSTSPASRARSQPARTWPGVRSRPRRPFPAGEGAGAGAGAVRGPPSTAAQRAIRTASARTCRAWRASSARGGVPSGGRGAGRVRRVVTARRAVASDRGRTSRSLELRANGSSGFRDVTGQSSADGPKANRNRPRRRNGPRGGPAEVPRRPYGGSRGGFGRGAPAPVRRGGGEGRR